MAAEHVATRFVGVDWAAEKHAACVVDATAKRTVAFIVAHTREGFYQALAKLRALGTPAETLVGIERPDGRLADRLLEAGFAVGPVSGRAIKAWRESEVASGAKSDPDDAEVTAEYLRLCFRYLKMLRLFSEQTRVLRAEVRAWDGLVHARVAARNQLEA